MTLADIDVCNCLSQLCHLKSHKTYLSFKFVCNAERGRSGSDKKKGESTAAIAELLPKTPTRVREYSKVRIMSKGATPITKSESRKLLWSTHQSQVSDMNEVY